MQRIVCESFEEPAVVTLREEPTPVPGEGEVLVEVDAAGVSFVDDLIARGRYQVTPALPYTPGSTVAGRVAAVGAGVSAPAVDDRVAALLLTSFGGFTSHAVLPASAVVAVPAAVAPEIAATAIESYCTLVFGVTRRVAVLPGEWVVVLGAGGGIGLAAVDVARGLGARVLAAASTPDKRDAATAAGAEAAIDYTDLKDRIREVTGGGADVVIDPVGGPSAEAALRALGTGGRFCVVGFASGEIPRLPANIVLLRNRSIIGVDWGDWARDDHAAALELVADVLGRISRGELHPPRPQVLPLAEAPTAFAGYANRTVTGKIALRP
ncbi:NADPH:quinone oxidoreductase family protein [Pseudonocardia sp. KRD291]|uniref:NADPH:quinone oxidoreductase family protein n=1 Tax=Pseudonocardia sp. KRD291 TaxID=2792007 RepID=UPI001C5C223E|nr:NADPH:quinone oxidoreductase family protein [Pseudonocardia sp. KRD291]MBW0103645.1 NADPH:quinone oxidoreductase family protein [Pseudonocardia sp. KRD291]